MPLVQLRNKQGVGVGTSVDVYAAEEGETSPAGFRFLGRVGFQEGGVWQVVHAKPDVDWAIYDEALIQARKIYPRG